MSHTYSTPGSLTYSVSFDTLDQMMASLPDNDQNLISAKDFRDTVLTLWWLSENLSASFSATASQFLYTNSSPSTTNVGGLTAGITFSNVSLQSLFDNMLYPYTNPQCSISASTKERELGSLNTTTLSWSVVKTKNNIQTITVDGLSVIPTGNSQSGTKSATSSQNVNTTFTMSVYDGVTNATASTAIYWYNAIYWGKTATFTLPSMSIVGTQPSWADGAGIGSGKYLTSSFIKNYDGIDGQGQYLAFAWPSSFGTPSFYTNGFVNTAFTKLGNGITFSNMYGYDNYYDVWLSNSAQNSPIKKFEIN